MDPGDTDPRLQTTIPSTTLSGEVDEMRVPCLTIAHHPDLRRVGERAVLDHLGATGGAHLSRLEPPFALRMGTAGRPLEDPFCSRRAYTLKAESDGALLITPPDAGAALEIDGALCAGPYRVPPERLRAGAGVFIGLARRVILHLGTIALRAAEGGGDDGLIGENETLAAAREAARRAAALDVPALILGESGTGKELVARAIVRASPRRDAPFVTLNMGAVPPSVAASELFGHRRGAFTGATEARTGALVDANGGTLFLDEIGLAPPEVQAMLLRAIETGEVRPLGERQAKRVNVRFIGATDLDLGAAVSRGTFSEALLNRLSGYVIRLPPLRERREDIGRLVVHFLRRELAARGAEAKLAPASADQRPYLSAVAMTRLLTASWRGNVRKLQNVVRQMVVAADGKSELSVDPSLLTSEEQDVRPASLAPPREAPTPPPGSSPLWTIEEQEERSQIVRSLERHAGNQTYAARDCGMSRTTFVARLEKYQIKRPRRSGA